jgi:alpha-glucoside transport system substrate-binding protein
VGLITKANSKSFVWYKSDVLAKYTDTAPATWDEFIALADKMKADGLPPHAIAGGKAWTLTDWFENIYLRIAGPEKYLDLFTTHTVSWTDPTVKDTMAHFAQIVGSPDLIAGGPSVALSLHYKDALAMVLSDPPKAGMFMEGGFMKSFAKESFPEMECGNQFGAFPFPSIDPAIKSPVVGSGDLAIAFNSNANTAALIQYLASTEAMSIWAQAKQGAVVSPHKGVSNDVYDTCTAQEAVALKNAGAFVFDGSDLAPGAVGGDAMPSGLQQFISEPGSVDEILQSIEDAASQSY